MSTQPHSLGARSAANSYLIGADPEFAILNSEGQVVPVVSPREAPSLTNPLGVAASFPNGKLGFDHGGRVIELRPDPSLHARDLLEDIQRTLSRRELWPYRKFKWKAGALAGNDTLGGHVHFDLPMYPDGDIPTWVRALDSVTRLLEGIDILPRQESSVRRAANRGTYGQFGDVRGSGRRPDNFPRLEYRTPASWLFSPHTTLFCLTALKLALVDPAHTLGVFEVPPSAPITRLKRFIRDFAKTDSDAREITEAIEADGNRLKRFRGDPSSDLKAAWQLPEVTSEELAAIPAPVEATRPNIFAEVWRTPIPSPMEVAQDPRTVQGIPGGIIPSPTSELQRQMELMYANAMTARPLPSATGVQQIQFVRFVAPLGNSR